MIIDLILNRKDIESSDTIGACPTRFNGFYFPIQRVYPGVDIPAEFKGHYCYRYNAAAFYREVREYVHGFDVLGDGILYALDYGEEADVKKALCLYIDGRGYNPDIKDYINSVQWLTPEV